MSAGEAGLCASCQHRRWVASGKGSRFLYCRRSETDPLFPKYPRLPVIHCRGYERGEEQGGKPPPGLPGAPGCYVGLRAERAGMDAAAIRGLLATVEEEALRRWVAAFSGPRHGAREPAQLAAAGERLEGEFQALGLAPRRDAFRYRGRSYFNVVANLPGASPNRPALLVGAHYDAMAGTPGADDNASGVAAMLAVARALAGSRLASPIEFVGFTLEEPQVGFDRYRHGSRHFARRAWWGRRRYAGVFILEMVGYTDRRPGSQRVLPQLRRPVPSTGDFLAAVGTRRARPLLQGLEAAREHVPELPLLTHQVALRGFLLPPSRWSDHAPFWDRGYPAVMLTDTSFLRNPHYHQPTDLPETLDYAFMAGVTRLVIATLAEMGG